MASKKVYIIKRVLMLLLVVFGVLIITFVITRVIPAHPEFLWAGPHPTKEQLEKARETLHLNDPIHVQLYYYLSDFLQGNWGISWRTRTPVIIDIQSALLATLELIIFSFSLGVILGLPLGVFSAIKRNKLADYVIRIASIGGASMPQFWFALLLQLTFANWLKLLPAGGRINSILAMKTGFKPITGFYLLDSLLQGNLIVFTNVLSYLILPSIALAIYPMCLTIRMTRAMMIDVLQQNYIRSAKAWGLPEKLILYRYAFKNACAPVIASLGLSFGYTIIGAFMIEIIFVWPGIGYYAAMSLLSFDYPAAIACIIVVAVFYSVINMVVDIVHSIIDPRVTL
jgi:peptide/nickel transport system permease protein